MRLAVISHKPVWKAANSPSGFATDGGFPFQIQAISELFQSTALVVPLSEEQLSDGISPLVGNNMHVTPLSPLKGRGLVRKFRFPAWLGQNILVIWKELRRADAVHAAIPGDVGTIGMLFSLALRKPLFVRHCGNWSVQRTAAEKFWKWTMEFIGGGRNVMLATGGSPESPSPRNENIKWIFSTSLRRDQIRANRPRILPKDRRIRLVIACRQEPRKGSDVVIDSMPEILKAFPEATLDVIGDGSRLAELKTRAGDLGLGEHVRFHGKLEHRKVLALLEVSHVFCFPTQASEGFPKAVLEALAFGIPVVTTCVSVLPELINRGGGILMNAADPSELAATVVALCNDDRGYEEMSRRALETADEYSLEEWQNYLGEILRHSWGVTSLAHNS